MRGRSGGSVFVADFGNDGLRSLFYARADNERAVGLKGGSVLFGEGLQIGGGQRGAVNNIARLERDIGVGAANRARVDVAAFLLPVGVSRRRIGADPKLVIHLNAAILFQENVSFALQNHALDGGIARNGISFRVDGVVGDT